MPYGGRPMCACGDLRCHTLIHCHHCGTQFKPFVTISLAEIVKRKLNYRPTSALAWYAALYERQLQSLGIKPEWQSYFTANQG